MPQYTTTQICSTVWNNWNYGYDTGTTCGTTSIVWRQWNSQWIPVTNPYMGTAANSVTLENATGTCATNWICWNGKWQDQINFKQASAEQTERWRKEEELRKLQREAEYKKKAEAKLRAAELLKANLTPEQVEELAEKNRFHLLVGNRKYRINRGRQRNIQLVDETGKVVKTLCAHPSDMIPDEDTMLAQKLMLEHNEQEFLRVANHS